MSYRVLTLPLSQSPKQVTPREGQVLDRVHYMRNVDIAADLAISPETVKTHLKSAYVKLGVETRAHAAVLWQMRRAA